MAEIKYSISFTPNVTIYIDSRGSVMAQELRFNGDSFKILHDYKTGKLTADAAEAEALVGKIIYGSVLEYVDKLGITEMYYSPDDEPF
jgi:hypothetical protein